VIYVLIMEPCCEKSAPWYVPQPQPYYVRTPGWSDSCDHTDKRVPVLTEHADAEGARERHSLTLGSRCLEGWMWEGDLPPEGERFRITSVGGSHLTGLLHGKPSDMWFPTADLAREHVNRQRESLYNIVGDRDMVVRWSSYNLPVGTALEVGQPA
jgi:hypothetical protein